MRKIKIKNYIIIKKNLEGSNFTFDLIKDVEILSNKIIEDSLKNTYYGDLNKWIINKNFNSFEELAYFTARIMYYLNEFATKYKNYYDSNKVFVYKGMKMPYSSILPYERAKGKIILFSSFISTFENVEIAENHSGRKNINSLYNLNKKFSVIFIIKNYYKKNWVSGCVKVKTLLLKYKKEKEILYLPFSFFFVKDAIIDHKNYKADIYLETIGKKEILEDQIRIGKEIKYNENEKIMEVK